MKYNLKNLERFGFKGGVMTSKTSISLLWKRIGDDLFYASGYSPGSIGVFRMSKDNARKFSDGKLSFLPPGFCSPTNKNTTSEGHELLYKGEVMNQRQFLSIIEAAQRPDDKKLVAKKRTPPISKGDRLDIKLITFLNKKRGRAQKEKLLKLITNCIDEKISELDQDAPLDRMDTLADTHQIGSMILESEAGVTEICV